MLSRIIPACLLSVALISSAAFARSDERYFHATEHFIQAKDLPEDYHAVVRSIQCVRRDAFEGSEVHSDAEQWLFDVGNKLHIESRDGTIRRRLLFHEGDTITKARLLETERALRGELFLADCIVEVMDWGDGTAHVNVHTWDHWSLTLPISINKKGDRWLYYLGIVEYNILGTGQKLALITGQELERKLNYVEYLNNAFLPWKLRLSGRASLLSDGYNYSMALEKPMQSRTQQYSFSASASGQELTERVYYDGNRFENLSGPPAYVDSVKQLEGETNTLVQFDNVGTHNVNLSGTRSFGVYNKLDAGLFLKYRDRYLVDGRYRYSPLLARDMSIDGSVHEINTRTDVAPGFTMSFARYDYKTVHNYHNLKWSENMDVGMRFTTRFGMNVEELGSANSDFYMSHDAIYVNSWLDQHFLNVSAQMTSWINSAGDWDDGVVNGEFAYQWKPVSSTATLLSTSWWNYFAMEKSQQLLLGEDDGLNGYPVLYYAGQASFLGEIEQRWFPAFEIGTLVPAFAAFLNGGNTFPTWDKFDPENLHYSVGVGLRIGLSKSTQKIVNHLNLSWPLEKDLSGAWPHISIIAKGSL